MFGCSLRKDNVLDGDCTPPLSLTVMFIGCFYVKILEKKLYKAVKQIIKPGSFLKALPTVRLPDVEDFKFHPGETYTPIDGV